MSKTKKILIALDSFKGSLSSLKASEAVAEGLKSANQSIETEIIPIADGGEGTVKAIIASAGGTLKTASVNNPMMVIINANYGILPDGKTAIIEMAQASGLTLIREGQRNPLVTSTYGTGQLIHEAVQNGCSNILLGIGGSATNDGGIGAAAALGIRFLDEHNQPVELNNSGLAKVTHIDVSQKLIPDDVQITLLCDVKNPLLGENGATYVYGKQKGADKEMLEMMEQNLTCYADVVEDAFSNVERTREGMGAAGGIGLSLVAFFNARLVSGIDFITEAIDIEEKIENADLIITGEGKLDDQSFNNKVPVGLSKLAKKYQKKVVAIVGVDHASEDIKKSYFVEVYSILDEFDITPAESMSKAEYFLKQLSRSIKI